jgi:hypothetical protein
MVAATGAGRASSNDLVVEVLLPVVGHLPCGTRSRLLEGVMLGWGKSRTGDSLVVLVVVEPVLTWFEACDDRMTCRSRMSGRVLTRR